MKIIIKEVKCPKCGAEEMHPDGDKVLIRGFKVHMDGAWWSQCLVCSGYYAPDLTIPDLHAKPDGGWFK